MIHLRLTHGASHSNGYVSASRERPDVYVESEAVATYCVESGFFEVVSNIPAEKPKPEKTSDINEGNTGDGTNKPDSEFEELEKMTVSELRSYAETTGIDLDGAAKKADIIGKIKSAESAEKEE